MLLCDSENYLSLVAGPGSGMRGLAALLTALVLRFPSRLIRRVRIFAGLIGLLLLLLSTVL